MSARKTVTVACVTQTDRLAVAHQPIAAPGSWLASYPIFQDALCDGETTFGALPEYAQQLVLGRTTTDVAERAIASNVLDKVRASAIELFTDFVNIVADSYLRGQQIEKNAAIDDAQLLGNFVEQAPAMDYPSATRPPCLLRTGNHVFLDSWMRFFSYRARGDLTIPLLAIDWLDFHERLAIDR